MSHVTSGRVFEVYSNFRESIYLDLALGKIDAQGANREIEEKRKSLEKRWNIILPNSAPLRRL